MAEVFSRFEDSGDVNDLEKKLIEAEDKRAELDRRLATQVKSNQDLLTSIGNHVAEKRNLEKEKRSLELETRKQRADLELANKAREELQVQTSVRIEEAKKVAVQEYRGSEEFQADLMGLLPFAIQVGFGTCVEKGKEAGLDLTNLDGYNPDAYSEMTAKLRELGIGGSSSDQDPPTTIPEPQTLQNLSEPTSGAEEPAQPSGEEEPAQPPANVDAK